VDDDDIDDRTGDSEIEKGEEEGGEAGERREEADEGSSTMEEMATPGSSEPSCVEMSTAPMVGDIERSDRAMDTICL